MKRKTIVLLSSIMASTLLVGGAFAAFAVTDNADPFGINVTPGDLDVDDTTYVTLKWGDSTGLTGIGNLKVGENRKAGIVSLKATPAYEGVFTLTIEDKTTAQKETTDAKLLDYLNVYAYPGNVNLGENDALPSGDPAGSIVKATAKGTDGKKTLTFNATGIPAGAEYSIFVNLDSSANPVFSQMQNDKVYLEVEWAPKQGDLSTNQVVYTYLPEGWGNVYAYSWNGEKSNAEWPGVKMNNNPEYANLYEISIPSDRMGNIIFNAGDNNDAHKTADLAFTGYDANDTPYWNGTAWAAKPAKQTAVVYAATVDGEAISLNNVKEPGSPDKAVFKVTLTTGQKIKFTADGVDIHFYNNNNEDQGVEYTATATGLHTFWYNKDSQMYVGQPSAQPTEVNYYLVGIGDKWGVTDGIEMTKVDDNHYKAEHVALAKDENIKVTNGNTGWWGVHETYTNCGWSVGAGETV